MYLVSTMLRILDAFGTALAVVFGLKPDPTQAIRVEDDSTHWPY